ncbi:hypothetical protein [Rhizobium sp. CC-YZS058]|uniref:hypothetical protein n=1 Tax=Rhizobium sp. CC-YZS058 TaxID=3042153 RepID=UPI002B05C276|nr:hypothetical protein [Rhizobium sp. CC-YZS058]MEA3533737.1 hypothetical protein [Rhizobium sp. CC-YZS058]
MGKITKAYRASGAIGHRRLVKFTATDDEVALATSPADVIAGVSDCPGGVLNKGRVDIVLEGIAQVEAGGPITPGAAFTADVNGRAVADMATGKHYVGGRSIYNMAAGDQLEAIIMPALGQGDGGGSLAKLRAASTAAKGNNPQELPDSTLGAVVTYSNVSDASLQPAIQIAGNPLIYKTSGKFFQNNTSNFAYVAHTSIAPSTGGSVKSQLTSAGNPATTPPAPTTGFDQGKNWNFRFKATGLQTIEYDHANDATNQPIRIIIDGQYVNRDGQAFNGVSTRYMKIAVPAGTHEVELELQHANRAGGLRLNAGAQLVEPTRRPKAVATGTSFEEALLMGLYTAGTFTKDAAGVARYAPWDGLFQVFCRLNGYDWRNSAEGGTGYSNTAGTKSKILDQMEYWIDDDLYDLIFFGGPYNDKGLNVAQMRADARAAWVKARTRQPGATIVVCGTCGGASVANDTSNTITSEAAIKAEFDAWKAETGETNAFFLPISSNYATALIKDTTYQDWISTDTTHPYRGDSTHGAVGIGYFLNAAWRPQIGVS